MSKSDQRHFAIIGQVCIFMNMEVIINVFSYMYDKYIAKIKKLINSSIKILPRATEKSFQNLKPLNKNKNYTF